LQIYLQSSGLFSLEKNFCKKSVGMLLATNLLRLSKILNEQEL